jgi:hypothetical protein
MVLNEAHALVMQGLGERIEPATAPQLRVRRDMLGASASLTECHAPDVQRQCAECIHTLDAACNWVFALVDTSLAQWTYAHAADCLGQLLLLDLLGDGALQTRLQDKMGDVQRRLENEVMSIRSMLRDEIPRDQDYVCTVEKIHKFHEGRGGGRRPRGVGWRWVLLWGLGPLKYPRGAGEPCAVLCFGNIGASTNSTNDSRGLSRSLTKMEFMLSIKLNFDTGVW